MLSYSDRMPAAPWSLYKRFARVADADDSGGKTTETRRRETVDADADTSLVYQSAELLTGDYLGQSGPSSDVR